VILVGERKPDFVSEEVRNYLANPPLISYHIRCSNSLYNRKGDGPYFSYRETLKDGWYKEASQINGTLFARAQGRELSSAPHPYKEEAIITYVDKEGNEKRSFKIENSHELGEDELMKIILKNRAKRAWQEGWNEASQQNVNIT
jgi:hypothetical protein